MKAKIFLAAALTLCVGILSAQELYGAFKIKTKPKDADVNLYDIDQYLCSTPSPVYPVLPDEYMELREGIPGRGIMLMITKKGYVPLKKEIYVPFIYSSQEEALENPTEFYFELERDPKNVHFHICWYYSYRWRRLRPHYHHDGCCHPWFPPGFWIAINPPHHPGGGHGHHPPGGGGHHPQPPPPGGGNPPPPPGGGNPPGGGITPPSPPGGGGSVNPPFLPPIGSGGGNPPPNPPSGDGNSKPQRDPGNHLDKPPRTETTQLMLTPKTKATNRAEPAKEVSSKKEAPKIEIPKKENSKQDSKEKEDPKEKIKKKKK